ncbi:MAG: FAD-dependent oxidoreductase [Candidatus Auribacterota bacterium]
MKEVVVIGAGFAGQGVVNQLRKNKNFHITIIDKNNFISYKPLFPDVAAGRLAPEIIEYPLEQYAKNKKIDFISGRVSSINTNSCEIHINNRKIAYDYLVIATGVETAFHGFDHFRKYAYTIDSLEECKRLQHDLQIKLYSDTESLKVSIIGGGYTGIETATHIRQTIVRHKKKHHITVIEAQDRILKGMPEWIQNKALKHLQRSNIEILTNAGVTDITGTAVHLGKQVIPADIIIWSAGMQGTDVASFFSSLTRHKRIDVDDYLRPDGLENVFIAGDASSLYRMSVPIAKQYAEYAASSIVLLEKQAVPLPFKAKDYGYIIALADHRGIGKLGILPVDGLFGYLFHYFMCGLSLLGWKNKWHLLTSILSNMIYGKESAAPIRTAEKKTLEGVNNE